MASMLQDLVYLLPYTVASYVLRFTSRLMRASTAMHKVLMVLDRGKRKVPPDLPPIGVWDKLTDRVVRINGLNPGMHTLQGTNCYLIGTGPKRILVDTGEGVEGFIDLLLEVMREIGCDGLDAIVLTHWHGDHTGGVIDVAKALKQPDIPVFKRVHKRSEKFEYAGIEDGQLLTTQGATLEAVYTPGHTDDHMCFILKEEQALLAGDMILGCGTAIFEDFTSYMASLNRVLAISQKDGGAFSRLYSGHGPVVEAVEEKILFYISHRQSREDQILDTMVKSEGRILSSLQITRRVYGALPLPLLTSAHYNVTHHLSKLIKEGRANTGWLPCSFRLASSSDDSTQDHLQGTATVS